MGFMGSLFGSEVGAANTPFAEYEHRPYVRPLQTGWIEEPTAFRATGSDPDRFEIICASCGDIDGPIEYQPVLAQQLRGPYESRREAERICRLHERASLPSAAEVRRARWHDRLHRRAQRRRMARLIETWRR